MSNWGGVVERDVVAAIREVGGEPSECRTSDPTETLQMVEEDGVVSGVETGIEV